MMCNTRVDIKHIMKITSMFHLWLSNTRKHVALTDMLRLGGYDIVPTSCTTLDQFNFNC